MGLWEMLKKLRGRNRDEQELSQPLLDRKDYEISSVVTNSNQLLQDRKAREISNVVTNSYEPFQDREGCKISDRRPSWSDDHFIKKRKKEEEERRSLLGLNSYDRARHSWSDDHFIKNNNNKKKKLLRNPYGFSSSSSKRGGRGGDGFFSSCEEETVPVARLSPTDVKVRNVGRVLQDVSGGDELRDWRSLPHLVLLFILTHFTSIGDFFAFSHVCREWRHVSESVKREYMATQPPLVCGISEYCGFYSWKEERLYRKDLLKVSSKESVGFSHGFLISLRFKYSKQYFALVNPVTGVEVMASFPDLPKFVSTLCVHASLSSPPTSPDCMLLLSDKDFIFLSRLGDLEWAVHRRDDEGGKILCETFFKGKVYALNTEGHILIYDHVNHPKFSLWRARNNPFKHNRWDMRLADCGGELFAIQNMGLGKIKFVIRRFDFIKCKWVRLQNLGNHVLFLDWVRGVFWDDATNWGGSGNCIYYLLSNCLDDKYNVFHMEDGRVEEGISFPRPFCSLCWVFPRLCC